MALILIEDKLVVDKATTIADLKARDGNRCMYPIDINKFCDRPFDNEDDGRHSVTIDHIYPQARAKADGWTFEQIWDLSNLQLMGKICNAKKSDLLYKEDGTLESRGRQKSAKRPRPEECEVCMNGRLLFPEEYCDYCGSDAQPKSWPKTLQREPKECDHRQFHCWMCLVHQPDLREPAYKDVFGIQP